MNINNYFRQNIIKYIFSLFILVDISLYEINNKEKQNYLFNSSSKNKYEKNKFAIIVRKCSSCGLFSVFMASIACTLNSRLVIL